MSDSLAGILGVLFIAGLFVAYVRQRRERNRPPTPVVAAEQAPAAASEPEPSTHSSSPNWGMPIVYCALLAGADSHRGTFWGYLWQAIFFALLAVAAYSMFSPRELAATQSRNPETTRVNHYITLGVPYLLFPVIGWVLVMVFGWSAGAFVPALPWAALLLMGAAFSLRKT